MIEQDWPASGRGILVTGAGSGIGRAIAQRFKANGDNVVGLDIRDDGFKDAGLTATLVGDAGDPEVIRDALRVAEEACGRLDVIVTCAGYGKVGPIFDLSIEDWDATFAVNVRQTFLMAKYGVPIMKKSGGGVIVPISSQLGIVTAPGVTAYSASKGGLIQLTRALGFELAADGVRINAVCPGPTDTPSVRGVLASAPDPAEAERLLTDQTAMKRLLQPREIADTVFFLASPGATGITGEAVVVDAGYVLS